MTDPSAALCCPRRQSERFGRRGPAYFNFRVLTPFRSLLTSYFIRAAGPGRARPVAGARARPGLHRRLPGRADREGRRALPHLGRGGVVGGSRRPYAWAGGAVPRVGARVSRDLGRRRGWS
jgi:hypothetical protein